MTSDRENNIPAYPLQADVKEEEGLICPLTMIGGSPRPCLKGRCAWYTDKNGGQCSIVLTATRRARGAEEGSELNEKQDGKRKTPVGHPGPPTDDVFF